MPSTSGRSGARSTQYVGPSPRQVHATSGGPATTPAADSPPRHSTIPSSSTHSHSPSSGRRGKRCTHTAGAARQSKRVGKVGVALGVRHTPSAQRTSQQARTVRRSAHGASPPAPACPHAPARASTDSSAALRGRRRRCPDTSRPRRDRWGNSRNIRQNRRSMTGCRGRRNTSLDVRSSRCTRPSAQRTSTPLDPSDSTSDHRTSG